MIKPDEQYVEGGSRKALRRPSLLLGEELTTLPIVLEPASKRIPVYLFGG